MDGNGTVMAGKKVIYFVQNDCSHALVSPDRERTG